MPVCQYTVIIKLKKDKSFETTSILFHKIGHMFRIEINPSSGRYTEQIADICRYYVKLQHLLWLAARKCLLSFGAESFVFQFAIHKF